MKKSIYILAVIAILLGLCGCSDSAEEKPIEIKGVFHQGNRIAVVFDYSDYKNPLPENKEDITLTVNGTVYNIAHNQASTSHDTGVTTRSYDCYERYYGYSYAQGYGTVSQGTPKRLLAVFYGIEDSSFDRVTFSLSNHTVNISASDIEEISTLSEIIKAEDNYEEAYQLAAFKWRIDSAYSFAEAMDKYSRVPFGSDFDYLSEQIALTFDGNVNWGVEVFAPPGTTYTYRGKLTEGVVNVNLPAFDVEAVKKAYPDAASKIDAIMENTIQLSRDILTPGKSLKDFDVKGTRGAIKGAYAELCKIFDMDLIIATHS